MRYLMLWLYFEVRQICVEEPNWGVHVKPYQILLIQQFVIPTLRRGLTFHLQMWGISTVSWPGTWRRTLCGFNRKQDTTRDQTKGQLRIVVIVTCGAREKPSNGAELMPCLALHRVRAVCGKICKSFEIQARIEAKCART